MGFILLEQKKIPFHEIHLSINENHFSPYSNGILAFCAAWLNKKDSFEIFTSGSTGEPQKMLWSREIMLWSIRNTAQALGLKEEMHCLHCIDFTKAGGKMMLARALEIGMSLEVVEPASDPMEKIISPHFDFAAMVPLQVQSLFTHGKLDELNKIDTLIIGGAALNNNLQNVLQKINTKVYTTYGMTETASHIALQRINGSGKQIYFAPFKDVELSVNEEGCAVIRTPFHEGIVTHDSIILHENNSIEITGRKDNVINSGGYKISLEKVEAAIDKALTVIKINFFNYCAYKIPDEKLGEALIVIFETLVMAPVELDMLKKEMMDHLEKYEFPKHFYFIDKLQYLSSGKIDKKGSAAKLKIEN